MGAREQGLASECKPSRCIVRFADGRGILYDGSIGKGYGGVKLFKASVKLYRCRRCKYERNFSTNHYAPCYPRCDCGGMIWDCRELDFDIIIKQLEEEDNANR